MIAGYIAAFKKSSVIDLEEYARAIHPKLAGVEQSEEVLEWIWDHFSAVAGDQPSFECWRE